MVTLDKSDDDYSFWQFVKFFDMQVRRLKKNNLLRIKGGNLMPHAKTRQACLAPQRPRKSSTSTAPSRSVPRSSQWEPTAAPATDFRSGIALVIRTTAIGQRSAAQKNIGRLSMWMWMLLQRSWASRRGLGPTIVFGSIVSSAWGRFRTMSSLALSSSFPCRSMRRGYATWIRSGRPRASSGDKPGKTVIKWVNFFWPQNVTSPDWTGNVRHVISTWK